MRVLDEEREGDAGGLVERICHRSACTMKFAADPKQSSILQRFPPASPQIHPYFSIEDHLNSRINARPSFLRVRIYALRICSKSS